MPKLRPPVWRWTWSGMICVAASFSLTTITLDFSPLADASLVTVTSWSLTAMNSSITPLQDLTSDQYPLYYPASNLTDPGTGSPGGWVAGIDRNLRQAKLRVPLGMPQRTPTLQVVHLLRQAVHLHLPGCQK
ncbi:hypothetical protein Hamer_G009395, partial [Homarus americanus]